MFQQTRKRVAKLFNCQMQDLVVCEQRTNIPNLGQSFTTRVLSDGSRVNLPSASSGNYIAMYKYQGNYAHINGGQGIEVIDIDLNGTQRWRWNGETLERIE